MTDEFHGDAGAGLGEAEFALDDYRSAEEAFKSALHWKPGDAVFQKRLELIEQILNLDPSLRGLTVAERYQRSRKLMEAALGALAQCISTAQTPPSAPVTALSGKARRLLLNRSRPGSYSDVTDADLAYAEQLWKARTDLCGAPMSPDEALGNIISRLSR
jgi:tetratricopeptide (TPR) repeat protein